METDLTTPKKELVGFCSAPWTDCITYADGELKACDRNVASFGNWQENGLKNSWHSEKFQDFRRAIREGRYPDKDCASCHNNGTQRTAVSSLIGAFAVHHDFIQGQLGEVPELTELSDLFSLKSRTEKSDRVISVFYSRLEKIRQENEALFHSSRDFHLAVVKLRVIAEALEDYLRGELRPRRVATFRQSQLQAKCTARCVMCAGKFTGEIVSGPTMDTKFVDEAFAEIEDVTDFWCNGAEYLFYKDWKKIALMLNEQGTKLRCSTNGILLTEETIRFMIDHKLLRFLTISLDGATKQTIESTRVNVKFEKTMERIRYLFRYALEKNYYFEFTAAFVMMKRNMHELPAFVRLIHDLRGTNFQVNTTVLCQPLENFNLDGYRQYLHQEHHVQVGDSELRRIFEETEKARWETGVFVSFYNQKFDEFMAEGMPIPRFFPRQMDVEIILAAFEGRAFQATLREIEENFAQWIEQYGYDRNRLIAELKETCRRLHFSSPVVQQTMAEFPSLAADIEEKLEESILALVERQEAFTFTVTTASAVLAVKRFSFGPVLPGEFVYSPSLRMDTIVAKTVGPHALLFNRQIVPALGYLFRVAEKRDLDGRLLAVPAAPPITLRFLFHSWIFDFYARVHEAKDRFLKGRKSLLLWKLSVAYRSALSLFGIDARSAIQLNERRSLG